MKRLISLFLVVFLVGTISCKKEKNVENKIQQEKRTHIAQKYVMDEDIVMLASLLMEKYGRSKVEVTKFPAGIKIGDNYAGSELVGVYVGKKLYLSKGESFEVSKSLIEASKPISQREFPSVWLAKDLRPYALKHEFSLWLYEVPFQQIERFDDKHGYDFWLSPNDKVIVKPKPQFIVTYKGIEYIIGYDGSIWLTHSQSHLRRGEPFYPERLK